MTAYGRDFNKTEWVSCLIKNEKILEKYNEIWKNVSNIIKKEFDSNPVYNGKYTKIKKKISYNWKVNTNFHNNKKLKERSHCICLQVILIDSVYKKDKNYHSKVFLQECQYVVKEKKIYVYYWQYRSFFCWFW